MVLNEQRFTTLRDGASVAPGRGFTMELTEMVPFPVAGASVDT